MDMSELNQDYSKTNLVLTKLISFDKTNMVLEYRGIIVDMSKLYQVYIKTILILAKLY